MVKKHQQKSTGKQVPPLCKGSVARLGTEHDHRRGKSSARSVSTKFKSEIIGCSGATGVISETRERCAVDVSDDSCSKCEPNDPGSSAPDVSPAAPAPSLGHSPQHFTMDSVAPACCAHHGSPNSTDQTVGPGRNKTTSIGLPGSSFCGNTESSSGLRAGAPVPLFLQVPNASDHEASTVTLQAVGHAPIDYIKRQPRIDIIQSGSGSQRWLD
ncbi:hypothetical protein MRX96_052001 [Rhipicephalus microplus]